MTPSKEQILEIIYQSLDEVNEQLSGDAQIQRSPQATLFGRPGGLDSLGFVNFIALVEEKWSRKYGIDLSLMDTSSREDDALQDVGKFADYLLQRMNHSSPEWL
jgi:acyl carrier protein